MLRRLSDKCRWFVEHFLPDAFVLTIMLTLITVALGMGLTRQTPMDMVGHWYGGFWDFLAFGMQMTMILLTGYGLAMAPPVQRGLVQLAALPKTPVGAVTLLMLVTGAAAWLSWGLGFVLGPIFARVIAQRVKVDFPLLVAAAYSAAVAILPMGLSITAPALVNTPGHFLEDQIGLIPSSQTIFSPMLLFTGSVAFIAIVLTFRRMVPSAAQSFFLDLPDEMPAAATATTSATWADRISDSRVLGWAVCGMGLVWVGHWFWTQGVDLNLNILNFAFLIIGIGLHGSLRTYATVFADGARVASGVILQFPFYAGIMGMMAGSGLIVLFAEWMASFATPYSYAFITMLGTAITNIFVPSAGGQWAIQGGILIEAARQLDIPAAVAVNAYTIGDMWTNLLQPFFALPALGIAGLGLRDIWGYCLVALGVFGVVACVATLGYPLLVGLG